MVEGIIRADCTVDIVDIDTSIAKFGTTVDTPNHKEQPVVSVRVRLEGYSLPNGDSRPWVDLRTTVEGWKKINESLALAVKSRKESIEGEHRTIKERLLG